MQNKKLSETQSVMCAIFGISSRDITPSLDIHVKNWSASRLEKAEGVHQKLLMQSLYIESYDDGISIILTADLGWWKNVNDEKRIREAILKYFSLKEEDLIFCLSHTHSGPSICSLESDKEGGEVIKPYLDFLINEAIFCIQEAMSNKFKGRLVLGYGVCDLAQNRDLYHNNEYLIGYNPLGKPDQTLVAGKIYDSTDSLRGIICNYACHPTTFGPENNLLSPDFVGELRKTIYDILKVPCLFLQGASGDLAPKKQYVNDPKIVEQNGKHLGYSLLATISHMGDGKKKWNFDKPLKSGALLGIWTLKLEECYQRLKKTKQYCQVPYKKAESTTEILRKYKSCKDRIDKDRLWRKYNTRMAMADEVSGKVPIWVWKLGSAILVAQPNEAYSLYQQEIRSRFPNCCIIFINIANGYMGYLPPKDLYRFYTYAVSQTPFEQGSLEILIEETSKVIKKLVAHGSRVD